MRYFERIGIPGPPPHFIKGNIQEIEQKGLAECHKQWISKYGRIIGYYLGCRPFILIADPELLKLIQIKNFKDFADRRIIVPGGTLPCRVSQRSVVFNKGRKWVETRSVLSPAFTSGKLKKMYMSIEDCLDEFLKILKKSLELSDVVDMHETFKHFSFDVIGRTAFGIKTDVQTNQKNSFITDSSKALSYDLTNNFLKMNVYFPEFSPVVMVFRNIFDHIRYLLKLPSTTGALQSCFEVIKARRANKEVRKCDLIQLMIDSKVPEEELGKNEEVDMNSGETIQRETINKGVQSTQWHSMADEEIQANAMLFMLAGHHTTSTCLTYTAYLLANHQEIQDKLRKEVNNIINEKGDTSYDDVMNLQYMDQVVNESLRLYPPVISFITRESTSEFRYKDLVLPKNVAIQAAVAVLHHDSEYWKDPMTFDPERFSPENKKNIGLYYQPFGSGRRNCVGMRFALLEIKLTLAKLIHAYKFLPIPTGKLEVDFKVSVTSPKGDVPLKLVPISS